MQTIARTGLIDEASGGTVLARRVAAATFRRPRFAAGGGQPGPQRPLDKDTDHLPRLTNRPILVTGAPRSGTTWVGRMLASHARVAYVAEPFNPDQLAGVPADHFFHHVTDRDAGRFVAYLERLLRFRAVPLPHRRRGLWHRATRAAVRALRLLRYRLGAYRPLMKDPIAFFSAEWLARTFGMDVVVLVRHPAALAGSLKRLDWHVDSTPSWPSRRSCATTWPISGTRFATSVTGRQTSWTRPSCSGASTTRWCGASGTGTRNGFSCAMRICRAGP
jgi:hypothetical protein